ncbi:MAG: shikimate kinase [Proteobacteria bacterium]|nr:shikimate kinase [Pseudomonadota bacterium]MBU0966511.1 shikimate kinase [Pseudomonadota bacterium]
MNRKKTKIVLTGYRATGKTSVGLLLAARLSFSFVDTDKEIEKQQGKSISEMVGEHGWSYFRAAERDFLASLLPRENLIVAPGGGAILHREVWAELMETSLVIWLQADVQTIGRRLSGDSLSTSQRPSLTGQDMIKEITAVLTEREPLYRQGSHYAVSTHKPVEEVVEEIMALWKACR